MKKIKKKAGIPLDAPAPKAYPTPKRAAPAPAPETEAPAASEAPAPAAASVPKAPTGPPVDAKADAKARLAERQAASAAAAEAAAAEKAAKAEAIKQAQADAQAERVAAAKAAAEAAEAKRAAAAAAKAESKPAAPAPKAESKPAPAPAKKAAAPAPASKPAPKKAAAKPKPKSPGVFDYVIGDVTVAALGSLAALALVSPSIKDKTLGGDVEGAVDEIKSLVTGANQDAAIGKACLLGGVVAVDAAIHLPVLGFFFPGPVEFVGTVAATLLAAKYFVTKESSYESDITNFAAGIPAGVPDVAMEVVEPVTKFAGLVSLPEVDAVVGDFNEWCVYFYFYFWQFD